MDGRVWLPDTRLYVPKCQPTVTHSHEPYKLKRWTGITGEILVPLDNVMTN